jgi:uncharacterized protein (DUF1499 family)
MSFLHWFTRNWADTDEPGDPLLAPFELPLPPAQALARVETILRGLPRWQVQAIDAAKGVLVTTRRTWFWGFVDEVSIRLEAIPGGTRIRARSRSRVGLADLGQNRRNLLELLAALRHE